MKKPRIYVLRSPNQSENHTIGRFIVLSYKGKLLFDSYSLERGGGGNVRMLNRTLAGTYPIVYEYSEKFDMFLWEIKKTQHRSEMKVHSANFWEQLNGCTSIGEKLSDIDGDGYLDVTSSVKTLKKLHKVLKPYEKETLKITFIDDELS